MHLDIRCLISCQYIIPCRVFHCNLQTAYSYQMFTNKWNISRFWTKFENLECKTHENEIFSIFFRVVCAKIKICSMVFLLRFLNICLSATNPDKVEQLNVRIVHWKTIIKSSHVQLSPAMCLNSFPCVTTKWIAGDWISIVLVDKG